jgi:hypothetical protein
MISVMVSGTENNPIHGFKWQRAAVTWANQAAPRSRMVLKQFAPVAPGPEGGRLRDSIIYRTMSHSMLGVSVIFTTSVPYAKYVLNGTPPHIIEAKRAKALHWTGRDGHGRFAKRVNHPGTRPDPFPRRAMMPMMPSLRQQYRDAMLAEFRRR